MKKKTLKALPLLLCVLLNSEYIFSQSYSDPSRYDIIISEIMAKPAPEVGLPAVEYIELHNRLPHPCTLRNWRLTLGNTSKNLPDIPIDSCGYAVLIAQKHKELMEPFCEHLVTLSSLAVADGGQALTLSDDGGEVIHYVNFKQHWHTERIKQEGGWSLEMIDDGRPCAGEWNWNSSTDPAGGTPGRPNSIRGELVDNNTATITGVTMMDTNTLRIHFSKTLTLATAEETPAFHTTPPLEIVSVTEVPPAFSALDIRFGQSPLADVTYRLSFSSELRDCGGGILHMAVETPFGVTQPPQENDLVINEILTNPADGEKADYLELYNRSTHIIDLRDVKVGYGGDTLPLKATTAVSKGHQLPPQSYAVLCRQRSATLLQYVCKDENSLLQCDSLPDFAIGEGVIHLTDISLRHIDRLAYKEEMHYDKLLTTKGVALERLDTERPTQDESNWRSAAESAGFGTPGYQNSQSGRYAPEGEFEVVPEVFSPDNDGFEDFAEVVCTFMEAEYRVNITLYNSRGHPVKHLANNVLCGTEARFRWDGDDDNHQAVPAGMYVAQIEGWSLRTKKSLRRRKVVSIYR